MFDLLIYNCRIVDGSGAPWYRGNVAVKDGRIVKIGTCSMVKDSEAVETVDGGDLYLAPGFIDIHSHSDITLMKYPQAESRILQGITTEIGGNCGMSAAPVSEDEKRKKELEAYIGEMDYDWHTVGEFLKKVQQCLSLIHI